MDRLLWFVQEQVQLATFGCSTIDDSKAKVWCCMFYCDGSLVYFALRELLRCVFFHVLHAGYSLGLIFGTYCVQHTNVSVWFQFLCVGMKL